MRTIDEKSLRPEIDDSKSAEMVRLWAEHTDTPLRQHYTRLEVVELVEGLGYGCSADALEKYLARGYVKAPTRDRWTARDIHALVAALEVRRKWQLDSKLHAAKFSRWELEAANNPYAIVSEAEMYSLEDLLLWSSQASDASLRECFRVVILAKLASLNIDP